MVSNYTFLPDILRKLTVLFNLSFISKFLFVIAVLPFKAKYHDKNSFCYTRTVYFIYLLKTIARAHVTKLLF